MVSFKRRVAAAFSSLFITMLLLLYIEVWKLLLSYLPGNDDAYERDADDHTDERYQRRRQAQKRRHRSDGFDRFREETEEEFARLIDLNSQITSSEQQPQHQDRQWRQRDERPEQQQRHVRKSPACHPHFRYLSSNTSWAYSDDAKFKRLYFYHARKAGGTSLAHYFSMVALHHGLKFKHEEWYEAEEPGTHELPTFYVTHLREPVDRAISHFKYQGRWDCRDLITLGGGRFIPTEENAMKIETWNSTGGHSPHTCDRRSHFKLGQCAVNCYIQWFSGTCPEFDIPIEDQYQVAKMKLLRYNFIVVLEWLSDPEYASAVESFFGVPGVTRQRSAYCERGAHTANELVPLMIDNHTLDKLTELNKVDIGLYEELTDCLDGDDEKRYNFPVLDAERFDNSSSTQVHYSNFTGWKRKKRMPRKRRAED